MATLLSKSVHIGEVVRNARVFNFKNWRGASQRGMGEIENMEPLLQTVSELFALLEAREVDYLLVGGIALLQYMEGRNTDDIDLIVAISDLRKLPEIAISHQDDDFARGEYHGLRIDFLLTRNRLFDYVRRHQATRQPFVERSIACATVNGLLLLKLYALPALYRLRNFARVGLYENDVATLLQLYRPALPPLFDELKKHLSANDLQALREVVDDIERRIARFEKQ